MGVWKYYRERSKKFGALFIALFFAFLTVLFGVYLRPNTMLSDGMRASGRREALLVIPPGSSTAQVADSLEAIGMLKSQLTFKTAAKMVRAGHRLIPGTYKISPGMSNRELIRHIENADFRVVFMVSVPEGVNMRHVSRLVASNLGIDSSKFLQLAQDDAFIHTLGVPNEAETVEGYLYPATYSWLYPVDEREVITQMVNRWNRTITDEMLSRADSLGLSLHEVMTFASIVEGETKIDSEQHVVAGVYWNRLKTNMRLQADPTVQYGLGLDRAIKPSDIRVATEYNTYRQKGLPPGPINNPQISAINAVLYPAEHDYLFFVARRDGTNSHYFSATLAEQNARIRQSNSNQGGKSVVASSSRSRSTSKAAPVKQKASASKARAKAKAPAKAVSKKAAPQQKKQPTHIASRGKSR